MLLRRKIAQWQISFVYPASWRLQLIAVVSAIIILSVCSAAYQVYLIVLGGVCTMLDLITLIINFIIYYNINTALAADPRLVTKHNAAIRFKQSISWTIGPISLSPFWMASYHAPAAKPAEVRANWKIPDTCYPPSCCCCCNLDALLQSVPDSVCFCFAWKPCKPTNSDQQLRILSLFLSHYLRLCCHKQSINQFTIVHLLRIQNWAQYQQYQQKTRTVYIKSQDNQMRE